jgi:general secretion pathway protein J
MRRQEGFSLVEVVIALSLAAIMGAGFLGAMRLMADSASRISDVSDRTADMSLIADFLRQAFGSAQHLSYRHSHDEMTGDGVRPFFVGVERHVRWVGALPVRHGVRGLHFLALRVVERGDGKQDLVLDYLPYSNEQRMPPWEQMRSHMILPDIAAFSLAYLGGSGPNAQWRSEWEGTADLPVAVRVSIRAADRYWPDLIFPFVPLP